MQRTLFILTKGQYLQKEAIFDNLPSIFQEEEALDKILPLLSSELANLEEEFQVKAGRGLLAVVQEVCLSPEHKMLVFKLSLTMLKVWSQSVIDEWVIVFKALIDLLHYPKVEKEILQTIFILSDISQPTISRYISARLIGFISKKMVCNYNP